MHSDPTPPTINAPERREAVARLIDPGGFSGEGDYTWDRRADRRQKALAKADAILALLAASSGERIASSDEMLCEGCGKSINRGQFVHVYDDVGEVHVDCDQPNAFSDDPMAMVMVGDPMRRIAPSAKASSGEREKALEEAARVAETRFNDSRGTSGQRASAALIARSIRALATPATVDEGKV